MRTIDSEGTLKVTDPIHEQLFAFLSLEFAEYADRRTNPDSESVEKAKAILINSLAVPNGLTLAPSYSILLARHLSSNTRERHLVEEVNLSSTRERAQSNSRYLTPLLEHLERYGSLNQEEKRQLSDWCENLAKGIHAYRDYLNRNNFGKFVE